MHAIVSSFLCWFYILAQAERLSLCVTHLLFDPNQQQPRLCSVGLVAENLRIVQLLFPVEHLAGFRLTCTYGRKQLRR